MTLAMTVRGEGRPVVLLHSGGMSSRQWKRLGDALAERYRVYAPDFLGAGANPPWPADRPFAFPEDVAAIQDLLAEIAEPVHLVGHSYGGFVGITVARERPERIRSFVGIDPVAFGLLHDAADAAGLADLGRVGDDPAFGDETRGGDARWFELFVDYWNGPGAWQALAPAARSAFLAGGRKVFFEVWSLMRDRTPASAYGVLRAPTLILTAERSPVAARRVADLLAAAVANGAVEVLGDGAGHMAPITHAETVNRRVAAHLAAADASAA